MTNFWIAAYKATKLATDALRAHLAATSLLATLTSCAWTPTPPPPKALDDLGCPLPSTNLFVVSKVSIDMASGIASKIITLRGAHIDSVPGVIDLLSQAARDRELREYILCRAANTKGVSQELSSWLLRYMNFLAATPTPTAAQIIEYETRIPCPSSLPVDGVVSSGFNEMQAVELFFRGEGRNTGSPIATMTVEYSKGDKHYDIVMFGQLPRPGVILLETLSAVPIEIAPNRHQIITSGVRTQDFEIRVRVWPERGDRMDSEADAAKKARIGLKLLASVTTATGAQQLTPAK